MTQQSNQEQLLKAILIDCAPLNQTPEESEYRLAEAENLIKTYGGIILIKKIQKKLIPAYKTYIGEGKIDELLEAGKEAGANILIVNNELKPQQTYNLEEIFRKANIQVWDRIDLILKIFEKHAQTKEAKLEIAMASLKHMGPRIFGMGMQLSRQGGGIGTKGVGETNIEFMKRHLKKFEDSIAKDLEDCKKVRKLHRETRKRKDLKTIGIIGYTNAGKSSLLNALTQKGAYVANKLFATLDTRVGKMVIQPKTEVTESQNGQEEYKYKKPTEVLLSDTIGFIQDLPTTLIKSFQSTLEETIESDLLLHVIDINDPKMESKIDVVNDILQHLKCDQKPCIYVFNKTDLLEKEYPTNFLKLKNRLKKQFKENTPIFISTYNKTGLEDLKEQIRKKL